MVVNVLRSRSGKRGDAFSSSQSSPPLEPVATTKVGLPIAKHCASTAAPAQEELLTVCYARDDADDTERGDDPLDDLLRTGREIEPITLQKDPRASSKVASRIPTDSVAASTNIKSGSPDNEESECPPKDEEDEEDDGTGAASSTADKPRKKKKKKSIITFHKSAKKGAEDVSALKRRASRAAAAGKNRAATQVKAVGVAVKNDASKAKDKAARASHVAVAGKNGAAVRVKAVGAAIKEDAGRAKDKAARVREQARERREEAQRLRHTPW